MVSSTNKKAAAIPTRTKEKHGDSPLYSVMSLLSAVLLPPRYAMIAVGADGYEWVAEESQSTRNVPIERAASKQKDMPIQKSLVISQGRVSQDGISFPQASRQPRSSFAFPFLRKTHADAKEQGHEAQMAARQAMCSTEPPSSTRLGFRLEAMANRPAACAMSFGPASDPIILGILAFMGLSSGQGFDRLVFQGQAFKSKPSLRALMSI